MENTNFVGVDSRARVCYMTFGVRERSHAGFAFPEEHPFAF